MNNFETLWQPGTDHAGIATQALVERKLATEKIDKNEIGREKFIEKVWEWKEQYGDIIINQLKKLGCSCDWDREKFTMDEGYSNAVLEGFVKLYDKGLIYKGHRLVNWCPISKSAISDEEVIHKEVDGHLWYFKYPIKDEDEYLIVATTRPETMLGDSAVAVNPNDSRYNDHIGKKIVLPLVGREIPIISDDYVDPEFGTGCVKITPAHDPNDFLIGERHNLEFINVMNEDASMNENVPPKYQNKDRFIARADIVKDLNDLNLLHKTENYKNKIGFSERGDVPIEFFMSKQWFMKMKDIAKPAINAVDSGEIRFHPEHWVKTYNHWLENIRDWCISRQLWWGHRIPAWYDSKGEIYVGKTEEEIREKFDLGDQKLTQEEDVLDTWFSSALWTFSTLGWPKDNNLLHRYHPTSVLVTGFDIIFFWVARMIMMTTHFIGEVPFKKIFIHGLIKDSEGQKMSKSKGNTLDPLDIIDGINLTSLIAKRTDGLMQPKMKARIEKQTKKEFPDGIKAYGTDALRLTFCSLASGGRDINFDLKRVEGFRNFCNKLWNASRYIQMNIENYGISETESETVVDAWINYKFDQVLKDVNKAFEEYRLDLATKALYEFIWYEFCDWYIEFCKISLTQEHVDRQAIVKSMVTLLEKILRLAHPIMPFVTEEIWGQFKKYHKSESDSLMISPFPVSIAADTTAKSNFQDIEWTKEIITGIRNIRGELLIKPSTSINALVKGEDKTNKKRLEKLNVYISNLCNLSEISWKTDASDDLPSSVFALEDLKVMIPLEGLIDPKEEKLRLDKKLDKLIKEKEMLGAKLSNDNFIKNAPEDLVSSQQERFNVLTKELENLQSQMKEIQKLI